MNITHSICIIFVFLSLYQGIVTSRSQFICRVNPVETPNSLESVAPDEFLECEIDINVFKRKLLPKPPHCGMYPSTTLLPKLQADLKDFPWAVVFEYERKDGTIGFFGSGVLINNRYVLTAADSVAEEHMSKYNLKIKGVRIGEYDTATDPDCRHDVCNDPVEKVEIEKIITHENYTYDVGDKIYDIALVRLSRNLTFKDTIFPICLPYVVRKYSAAEAGSTLYMSGWRYHDVLDVRWTKKQIGFLTHIDSETCDRIYRNHETFFYTDRFIKGFHICGARVGALDNCRGYKGSPLMQKRNNLWILEGLTSQRGICGSDVYPGVFINIDYFNKWILSHLDA